MTIKINNCDGFNWDDGNSQKNWDKHAVHMLECEEVFFNHPLYVLEDDKHSSVEKRYYALGKTDFDRLLFIVFTIRNNKIRVISARDMSKSERKVYHEKS
jgi:uncharacterized protein